MRRKLLFLIALLALVAASCGSSSTVESGTAADTDDSAADTATETSDSSEDESEDSGDADDTAAEDEAASDDPFEYDSPLFDLLGFDPSSFEDIDYEQVERDRQVLVQECMVDQGFEYQPVDYGNIDFFAGPGSDLEWGTRAFAETYGYGISTFFEDEIAMSSSFSEEDSGFNDPNQAYLEFLSDGERTAWEAALYGTQPELFDLTDPETGQPLNPETNEAYTDEEMDAFWQDYEPSGCQNAGYEDGAFFGGEDTALIDGFFTEFEDVFETMGEQMENDPRIANITDDWVRCMADKSYSFSSPDDVWEDVNSRMEPIRNDVYGFDAFGPAMFDVSDEDMAAMSEEEAEEFFSDFAPPAPEITPEIRKQLDAVVTYELALAVADFDCAEGNDKIYQDVQKEIELRFIEENQGAITAFLEANQG